MSIVRVSFSACGLGFAVILMFGSLLQADKPTPHPGVSGRISSSPEEAQARPNAAPGQPDQAAKPAQVQMALQGAAKPAGGAGQARPSSAVPVSLGGDRAGRVVMSRARPNVPADFNPDIETPSVDASAYLDPMSSVIGHVKIGRRVYLAPFASVRGDEGQPIHIGHESNVQDGVVIHALETISEGKPLAHNTYEVQGKRYAVYVGDRVSLAHQSQVHGPAWVEDDSFVGMQALVFKAHVGKGCVIEPGAKVIGVTIPPGRYVKAGSVVSDQKTADQLPAITESYAFRTINKAVVHVNTSLADGYSGRASHSAKH